MVHGVSVFAPVVEVDAQSRVSQPVTTLDVTTPAAGSVCSLQLFFLIRVKAWKHLYITEQSYRDC